MARKEPSWLADTVFYEIYPQSFCDTNGDGIGDLNGVIAKLDYVKSLGCGAIWLNPFYESPFADAGYDISDYYKVAPRYGTNEDFARLCRVAHEKGLRVIADLVPCHTSIAHPWFRKSCEKERNEYSDTYIWCDDPTAESDRLCKIAGGRSDRYYRSYYETQPAINYGFAHPTAAWQKAPDDPVCVRNKEELLRIMDFWIALGCDGFRVDMANYVIKDDPDQSANKRFWREVRAMFDEKYPECVLIPEWSRPLQSLDAGFHLDMFLSGGSLFRREKPEIGYYNYFRKAGRGILSRFTEDYLAWLDGTVDKGYISFVTGNHDQPRISLGRDAEEIKVVMAFVFSAPGAPFLYYGDEIGMRFIEGIDKEGSEVTRGGSRTPMQWEKGKKNFGFSDSDTPYLPVDASSDAPSVSEQEADPDSLLQTVRSLIALRHAHRALWANGSFRLIDPALNYPFWYERSDGTETVRVLLNPSGEERTVTEANAVIVLAGHGVIRESEKLIAGPCSYLIYSVPGKETVC